MMAKSNRATKMGNSKWGSTCPRASLIVSRKARQHDVFREPCYVDYPAFPVIPQKEQEVQCL